MKFNSFWLAIAGLLFLATSTPATVRYVSVNNANPMSPYTNWATAATDIQSASDVAAAGDLVLVSNGVYETGSREAPSSYLARVLVRESITVKSLNGPAVTIIKGYQVPGTTNGAASVRCVYLPSSSTLSGFTLTNGATSGNGGGIFAKGFSATVSNCVIVGNAAGLSGGGGCYGSFVDCVIRNNVSFGNGGGLYSGAATNCLIVGNSAQTGGGTYDLGPVNCTISENTASAAGGGVYGGSVMKNSIVYYNSAPTGRNYYSTTMSYCCTVPIDALSHSLTNEPLLVNSSAGDYRLQSNSPCINAGTSFYATLATDLDGNPRIIGGTVDIGAFECQSPAQLACFTWLQGYGLPTTAAEVYTDSDGDGMNNWQEWQSGTNPTNALSLLKMMMALNMTSGTMVTWQSVSGKTYFLERSGDLKAQPVFSILSSNIVGQAGTTSYFDVTAVGPGPVLYRVGIQP